MLSVHLRLTDTDYPCGIIKLFLNFISSEADTRPIPVCMLLSLSVSTSLIKTDTDWLLMSENHLRIRNQIW